MAAVMTKARLGGDSISGSYLSIGDGGVQDHGAEAYGHAAELALGCWSVDEDVAVARLLFLLGAVYDADGVPPSYRYEGGEPEYCCPMSAADSWV
jgi:hypothetical protein